jgi:HPt (histidine-containing phosphotransfer) domain-containing protein
MEEYLPDINIDDGKARVMDNMKLYLRLVKKFDGSKMAGDIINAINEGNTEAIRNTAHALKGLSANLGFTAVQRISAEIEALGKDGKDCSHMEQPLTEAIASLAEAVGRFLATQEESL